MYNEELHFDERSYGRGDRVVSPFVANAFFTGLNDRFHIDHMSPVARGEAPFPEHVCTVLPRERVEALPVWTSVTSFAARYLKPSWRRQLRRRLQAMVGRYDLIWNRQPAWGGLVLTELAVAAGVPVFMHVAGDIAEAWRHPRYAGPRRLPARLASWVFHRRLLRSARSPLVLPLCTGTHLQRVFARVNPRSEFFVDSTVTASDLAEPPRGDGVHRLLYVGRLTADKGVLVLLAAFARMRAQAPDTTLTIVGRGELAGRIAREVADRGLAEHCRIVGFVPHAQLGPIYREHDALVLPTTLSEGFPRVILEAWAAGLPVVASDVGGIRGLAVPGRNALFCEPGCVDSLAGALGRLVAESGLARDLRRGVCEDRQRITREHYQDLVVRHADALW